MYYGGALLLDPDDPARVLRWTAEPFFSPEADFEVAGFVPNVVFPTGVVQDRDSLLVYYGAADAVTAVAEYSLGKLLDAMTNAVGGYAAGQKLWEAEAKALDKMLALNLRMAIVLFDKLPSVASAAGGAPRFA